MEPTVCNSGVKAVSNIQKTVIIFLALFCLLCAVKIWYGGEITIRLNEPPSFSFSPSDYSNLVFYSLIYENFFYLKESGDIHSNLFESQYNKEKKTLILTVKDNLSFSNGDPITAGEVKSSLRFFLDLNLASAKKLRGIIKSIYMSKEEGQVFVELLYDNPDIVSLMTAPELVLLSGNSQTFSGSFYPAEKVQDQYITLRPNKFYPGGRTYLDSLKVIFYDSYYPDVFLAKPGQAIPQYQEFNAGVYQNLYILFPEEQVGQNTRIALYSLLRDFYKTIDAAELNALTSNEESPITLNIKTFSDYMIRQILRYSRIKLYIPNSLSYMEQGFQEFLRKKRVPIETIYLGDNQLQSFMENASIKYLLLGKVFNKRMQLEEKIEKIVKEMSFSRFNEKYLKLINELDEVKYLKNEEMLINHITRIIEQIIQDGFILPLFQNRYSLYVKDNIQGVEVDYYGRPLFQGVRLK